MPEKKHWYNCWLAHGWGKWKLVPIKVREDFWAEWQKGLYGLTRVCSRCGEVQLKRVGR